MSECRICLNSEKGKLVAPCKCNGSIKHIHQSCLIKWIKERYPTKVHKILRYSKSNNQGFQCELCKSEFKFKIKYLQPLQILRKIKSSNITYCVLMNIPIIVYLSYKCSNLLRHLFLFIYDQSILLNKSKDATQRFVTIFKFYFKLCTKLFPVSLVIAVLPMIIYSTYTLTAKLITEFKTIQFEE